MANDNDLHHDPDKEKEWLTHRFATSEITDKFIDRRVVKEPWYYGEGAALILLVSVLFGTGAFLALGYSASPQSAYASLVQITEHSTLGWFLRALHYWSAGLIVVTMIYHVLRHVLLGGYLPPREGTWLLGVGLFILIIANSFTGYTLRWDERAIYAIRIPLNMIYNVPFIGDELVRFIQGGWEIGAQTLSRLYALHVIFVPLALLLLIGYHLHLVVTHGVTTSIERELGPGTVKEQERMRDAAKESDERGEDFFPETAARSMGFAFAIFAIVIGLSLFIGPQKLGREANLIETSFPKEEWWFGWYSGLIAYLPPWLAPVFYIILPIAIIGVMLILPFVDKGDNRGLRRRPLAAISVTLIVIVLLLFTSLRISSPWTAWPSGDLVPIPDTITLNDSAAEGRVLFTQYGCNTCHAVGGYGPGFGPNLSSLKRRLSPTELHNYISQPPEGVAMPSYGDRLQPNDLKKIVDFVLVIQTLPNEY